MGFLTPANLLWAVALAVLAAIYLRSRARPTITVSSLMLFDEAPAPAARIRHLRVDPLFWLETAALTALVLAAAGLYAMVPARAGQGRSHALVFDIGAAMSARSGGATVLDDARRQAMRIVDGAPAGDEFSIITYALEAQVALPQTRDLDSVRKALKRLSPLAVPARASALTAAVMRARGSSDIELFTDRQPPARAIGDGGGEVRIHMMPHGDDNVAIVSLDPGADASRGRAVLRNFSARPRLAEFRIQAADREIFHQTLMFAPREQMVLPFAAVDGGLVAAHILTADAIEADNQRWAYAPGHRQGRALVLSRDAAVRDDLARVLLAVDSDMQIQTADPSAFQLPEAAKPFDLIVMHDCYAPGLSAPSTLLIYPPTVVPPSARIPGLAIAGGGSAVLSAEHAQDGIVLSAARTLEIPEWMETVASGSRPGSHEMSPLAAIGRIPGGKLGVIAFDVRDRMLLDPDRLEALVVTVKLIKRLTAPGDVQIVPTGAYLSLPVGGSATVAAPDGSMITLEPDKWGRVELRPLLSGHYSVQAGRRKVDVFANYFDASESDLASPPAHPQARSSLPPEFHAKQTGPRQAKPLLILLAGLAMAAFVVESFVLARRAARWGMGHV